MLIVMIMLKSVILCYFFFFFKQKTAYEISSRDWSSDVCSSDLGMVRSRIGADQEYHLGVLHVVHLVRHRAGIDAFHQRRDRRGVAKARAMVDVVGAEAGAHQLLEEISLLVGAFSRPEAGQCIGIFMF